MPELVQQAIGFYSHSPDGQYDEIAVHALRHYLATLQAQPAEVSDAQIAAGMRELFAGPKPWPSWEVTLKRVYQAMFALRPQAVPMDQEAAWGVSPVNCDWEAVDAYMQGIADAEAHHGITAQGAQEGK